MEEREKKKYKNYTEFQIEAEHYKETVCDYKKAFKIYDHLKGMSLFSNKPLNITLKAKRKKTDKWKVLASVHVHNSFYKTTRIGFKQNVIPYN